MWQNLQVTVQPDSNLAGDVFLNTKHEYLNYNLDFQDGIVKLAFIIFGNTL